MTDTYDLTNPLKPTILVDPNSVLDYVYNFTEYLDDVSDTIASVQMLPIGASVLDVSGHPPSGFSILAGNKSVVAWIKGMSNGNGMTCRITTAAGRVDDRSIYFKVKER